MGALPRRSDRVQQKVLTTDVAACERAQTAWFDAVARVSGGSTWTDGGLHWAYLPASRSLMLMFPRRFPVDGIDDGVRFAAEHGLTVGAWLSQDVDGTRLGRAGFEPGWQPWWMARGLSDLPDVHDDRVRLESATEEYEPGSEGSAQLALVRERPDAAWHAAARVDGRLSGHAWSHLEAGVAGVFDMVVWRRRRTGLGTALLLAVCAAAARAGASSAVLNATPMGEPLYASQGFRRLGDGMTWWRHPRPDDLRIASPLV